jgi:hypothetical protein
MFTPHCPDHAAPAELYRSCPEIQKHFQIEKSETRRKLLTQSHLFARKKV